METLLEARELSCSRDQSEPIFSRVSLLVNEGDVIVIQAKSGAGWVPYVIENSMHS
jgi:ABC-type transport system involved in cytochrome c biogenesis ATPase subunit